MSFSMVHALSTLIWDLVDFRGKDFSEMIKTGASGTLLEHRHHVSSWVLEA